MHLYVHVYAYRQAHLSIDFKRAYSVAQPPDGGIAAAPPTTAYQRHYHDPATLLLSATTPASRPMTPVTPITPMLAKMFPSARPHTPGSRPWSASTQGRREVAAVSVSHSGPSAGQQMKDELFGQPLIASLLQGNYMGRVRAGRCLLALSLLCCRATTCTHAGVIASVTLRQKRQKKKVRSG